MPFPKAYADRVAKLRVPGGFVLAAAFVWLAAPTWASLGVGAGIALAGLGLRAWAAGHLEKNLALCDGGPYQYLRNPLYVGTLTVAAGFAVASRRWELGVLFAAVFLLIYLPVVELEEQHLRELFPAYARYAGEVPRLWPRLPKRASPRRFRWAVFLKNQEYQAWAGFAAGIAVLAAKCILAE